MLHLIATPSKSTSPLFKEYLATGVLGPSAREIGTGLGEQNQDPSGATVDLRTDLRAA